MKSQTLDFEIGEFFYLCRVTLDQHAPRKQKYALGSHMPFKNKTLLKKI